MATVTIKIDNKIKMDRGHMNLRTAHQEQFICSRRKIERGEGVFHSASTLGEKKNKNQPLNVVVFTKRVLWLPNTQRTKKALNGYFLSYFALKKKKGYGSLSGSHASYMWPQEPIHSNSLSTAGVPSAVSPKWY